MPRWALSPIIGNGGEWVESDPLATGPYRARVTDAHPVAGTYLIPANDDGTPRFGWCLVKVPTLWEIQVYYPGMDQARYDAAIARVAADGEIRLLPDWPMAHVITAGEGAAITDALDHFGITGYPSPVGRTVRQVVRWISDRLDLTWDVG